MTCARSWGTLENGWTFCTLARGHAGCCSNKYAGDKPLDALFFEEQPKAVKWLEDQRIRQAKEDAR